MLSPLRSLQQKIWKEEGLPEDDYLPLSILSPDGDYAAESGVGADQGAAAASNRRSRRQGDDGAAPTKEELTVLRRVPGKIPAAALIIAVVELAERGSYYGCLGVFPNFIQRPLPPESITGAPVSNNEETPGALGKGLQTASAIISAFSFMAYLWPLAGGLIADLKLNKFRTIALGVVIGFLAHMILVYAAWPTVLVAGDGMPPFVLGIMLLSFSTGLIKSNIGPLLCDQIQTDEYSIRTLASGERVIVDRSVTIQRAMNLFYLFINLGGFFSVLSTFAEKYIGFWMAFAIPGVIFLLMPILLAIIRPSLTVAPPQGSILVQVSQVCRIALGGGGRTKLSIGRGRGIVEKGGDGWERAKPEKLAVSHGIDGTPPAWCTWDADFVDQLKKAFHGCKIFLFFPIYWLCVNGLGTLVTSLTASMTTHGVPNDSISSLNSMSILLSIPVFNFWIYPALRDRHIEFGPVRRVVLGFLIAAAGYFYGAMLQWRVYKTSPCGYYASDCTIAGGVSPISAWATAPMPILSGLSEVLASVTGLEIAYNQAPPQLKSFVTALFLLTSSFTAAIALALVPLFKDPYLVWPFFLVALVTVISAIAIHRMFSDLVEIPADAAAKLELEGSEDGDLDER